MNVCRNIIATLANKTFCMFVGVALLSVVTVNGQQKIPDGAHILMKVYPDFVKDYRDGQLVLADGSLLQYDDGREKSFVQKLDDADPEDMFAFKYDRKASVPEYLQDAGRSR